jgi:ribosomal protein S18 acetylase RimI-like enzyme
VVESGGLENRCARKGTEGSNPSPSASSARVPLAVIADSDLYARGNATLLASWEAYAHGSAGAALHRLDGVAAAVFPSEPERGVFNNALLDRDVGAAAVDAMEDAYRSVRVERFAAWVHETDERMHAELRGRGYTVDTTTRAMGMSLTEIASHGPDADVAAAVWTDHLDHLEAVGVPAGLLRGADPTAFHVVTGRAGGEDVATAIAIDHDGDCGIFNVSTVEEARRRGLGTAMTLRLLRDAAARGCATASLQSTEIAERVYAAAGFRDLGRFVEYVPAGLIRSG